MVRGRVERRAAVRAAAKELRQVHRELAARGIAQRMARVNKAVAPGSGFFWQAVKARIAAREFLTPIRDLDEVRAIALKILAAEHIDMSGLTLKVEWQPPTLWFEAVPEASVAMEAVTEVRARR